MTAANLEQLPKQFPDVMREAIGRFKGWSVGAKDVHGDLHSIFTKVPYVFASENAACQKEIDSLISNKVIEPFSGKPRHVIPFFSVAKKDSTERRIVLDFRALNKLTLRSPALPLHRDGIIQSLSGHRTYAKFDFRHGFYQIALEADLKPYFTVFINNQLYTFRRLPMGWLNSMAFFDNAVRITLSQVRQQLSQKKLSASIESYADDVCIGASSEQELSRVVRIFLETCRQFGWTISPRKSIIGVSSLEFLGYTFSSAGVSPSPALKSQVEKLKPPTSKTQIRSCLGIIRTLLRFCRVPPGNLNLLQTMLTWKPPAIEAHWKRHPSHWTQILKTLKNCYPNHLHKLSSHLELYVDSCRDGYGFGLFDKTSKQLIQLGAGSLDASKFSSSGRAELIGLSKSLKAVRHLLLGRQFTIFTDATTVKQGNSQANVSLLVQKYINDLNLAAGHLKHIDGVKNVIADLLSRSQYWRSHLDSSQRPSQVPPSRPPAKVSAIKDASLPDWFIYMPEFLKTSKCPEDWTSQKRARQRHRAEHFRLQSDQIQYSFNGSTWIPCCLSPQDIPYWLHQAHEEAGHYGVQETLSKLQRLVYFPGASSYVKDHVRSCPQCQKFARRDPTSQQTFSTWQFHNQGLGLDFIGPLPADGTRKYILCCIDLCTRWTLLQATSDATAKSIVKGLESWSTLFGFPSFVQTDNAAAFVGNSVSQWLSSHGIQRRVIPAFKPQCNGTTERANQEVIRRLQRMKTDDHWVKLLPQVQQLINSFPNSTTGISAYEATFGYLPRFSSQAPLEQPASSPDVASPQVAANRAVQVQQRRWQAVDHSTHLQDRRFQSQAHRYQPLSLGSQVLYFDSIQDKTHGAKFQPHWTGPFTVESHLSSNLYRIKPIHKGKSLVVHRDLLRRYFLRSFSQGSDCDVSNLN